MKKFFIPIISILSLIFSGCNNKISKNPENILSETDKIDIIIGTDLHYLSPSLTDEGEFFLKTIASGDGKLVQYSEQITDAFFSEVKEANPDVLILSGDLTFNGEKQSHLDFKQKLSVLKSSGINVLVIPGNHDIDYPFAYYYEGDNAYSTENVSEKEFKNIYSSFGYDTAISRDKNSFSYLHPISKDLYILMLDTNTEKKPNQIRNSTLNWIEDELKKAYEENINVICVSHQNLLQHNKVFSNGFVINNNTKLLSLFEKYNVSLNLSGHMHIQNISKSIGNVYDIATGSLAVAPNYYGLISIDEENTISYKTKKLDVTSWAKNKNIINSDFSNFETYSKNFFDSGTYTKLEKELKDYNLTEDEIAEMCNFAVEVNSGYFHGTLFENIESLKNSEAYNLWLTKGSESFFTSYLNSILDDTIKDETKVTIEAKN